MCDHLMMMYVIRSAAGAHPTQHIYYQLSAEQMCCLTYLFI